jgi:predicted kinase
LAASARSASALDGGLYTSDATERTYRQALALAVEVAAAGRIAIVDGTFLKRWQRDLFRERASMLRIPFVLIDFAAADATLRARVAERACAAPTPRGDLAVLDSQLRTQGRSARTSCPARSTTMPRRRWIARAILPRHEVLDRLASAEPARSARGSNDISTSSTATPTACARCTSCGWNGRWIRCW